MGWVALFIVIVLCLSAPWLAVDSRDGRDWQTGPTPVGLGIDTVRARWRGIRRRHL